MPYFEVEQSVIDGLDEDLKGKFAAYQPEDVSGLKDKANEAVNEAKAAKAAKKDAEAKVTKLEADLAQAKLNRPAGDADKLQEQLDDANAKLAKAQDDYSTLSETVTKNQIKGEAARLAAGLTKDATKAEDLTDKFVSRLAFDEGSLKVLDADGKFTISSTDDLINEVKGKYPYLVDGSPASGGGAAGQQGGAGKTEKTIPYSEYQQLAPREKAEKQKAGFSVVDDE